MGCRARSAQRGWKPWAGEVVVDLTANDVAWATLHKGLHAHSEFGGPICIYECHGHLRA